MNSHYTTPEPGLPQATAQTQTVDSMQSSELPDIGFDPAQIARLPAMTLEQLSQIEEQLSREFSSLSREYVQARSSRAEHLLTLINLQISAVQDHDQEWSKRYNFEIESIECLANNTENRILAQSRLGPPPKDVVESLAEYELELKELLCNMQLPLELDDIFKGRQEKLPFAQYFEKILKPFGAQLTALANENTYQKNLISSHVEREKQVIWKQYRRDVVEHRQHLIDLTYRDLNKLYEEYHGVNANEVANKEMAQYHRSVVSTSDMKHTDEYQQLRLATENNDSYYDLDNVYYKKNKIALTGTKTAALERLNTFAAQQQNYSIPQREDATVVLGGCSGLSQQEVDSDLAILSQRVVAEKRVEMPEEAATNNYKELLSINKESSQLAMQPLELNPGVSV